MTSAEKIQAVINTLETLAIAPTVTNTGKMYGIYQVLAEVRDELAEAPEEDEDVQR